MAINWENTMNVCRRCRRELESHNGKQPVMEYEITDTETEQGISCCWCNEPYGYMETAYIFM